MPHWVSPGHAMRRRWPLLEGLPAILATVALLGGAAFLAARLDPLPPRFSGEARASDGDSLRLGADRIRLLGLDAPELDQVCWRADGGEWPCGREARALMVTLLGDGAVTCLPQGNDRYGRTLAHCEVAGSDVGARVVEAGLAVSSGEYEREESLARGNRLGIWQGRFVNPREWRDEGPSDDPGPGIIEQLWTWFRELTGARALR